MECPEGPPTSGQDSIWSLPITDARSADVRGDRPARPLAGLRPDTAGAIYGTIVAMAVIAGTAADPGHGKALSLTVATLAVFWLAHVYAQTLSHHLKGAKRLEWPAVKAAMVEEQPLLEGPLPMLVVLVLGSCTCSRVARPSGWPCGSAWPSWSPGASSTRAGSGGAGRRRSPRAWSTVCSGWRSCSSRWSCTDRGHGCPAAASTAGWAGRRPRNSMSASTTSSASVRPRTTLPVGRPQNTRARAARATAPMRRAFLLAYTQLPTGPVENPARSAPRPASRWRG